MKYSLKKQYKKIFENTNVSFSDKINILPNINFTNTTQQSLDSEEVEGEESFVSEADGFQIIKDLEERINNFIYSTSKDFSLTLIFGDDQETRERQKQNVKLKYYEIINYIYFLLKENEVTINDISTILEENVRQNNSLIKESDMTFTMSNFLKKYFHQEQKGSTKVVSKLVGSKNLLEFKSNLFYFLIKKLVDKGINLKQVSDAKIVESVNDIIGYFAGLLTSKQALLTVDFGAFFEEVFREAVYKCLNIDDAFELNVEHKSKKLAIVLIYCCNEIFEKKNDQGRTSSVYSKIVKGEEPTDSDYRLDYLNIRYADGKNKEFLLNRTKQVLQDFSTILFNESYNSSSVYCDDFENDSFFKQVAENNSPFDFIIREKDIVNSTKNIGLFDLKASNQGSSGSPLSKGATGNNSGTLNTALTFVNKMTQKIKDVNKTHNIGISFFGLIQMEFILDFKPTNNFEISIEALDYKISPAMSSALYSIDKDHFYLSDNINKKHTDFNTTSTTAKLRSLIDDVNKNIITDKLDFEVRKKEKVKNAIEEVVDNYKKLNSSISQAIVNFSEIEGAKFSFMFNPNNFAAIYSLKNKSIEQISQHFNIDVAYLTNNKSIINAMQNDNLFDPVIFGSFIIDCIKKTTSSEEETEYDSNIYSGFISSKSLVSDTVKGNKNKTLTKLILNIFDEENAFSNTNVLRSILGIAPFSEKNKANNTVLTRHGKEYDKYNTGIKQLQGYLRVKEVILNKIKSDYLKSKIEIDKQMEPRYSISDVESEEFNKQYGNFNLNRSILGLDDHRKYIGSSLKEVYSQLFRNKILKEGGLAGHMMHPYEALDMTPRQIIDRIKEYSTSQKIIEKVDGQNLFFTVEQDGTLMFARNKEDMTHDDLVAKFTGHGAEKPFVEGGNAIKSGVEQWLQSAGPAAEMEIKEVFHPDGETKSFINFEIMHPDKPNQIVYDEKYIVFHSIVDYVDGRKTIHSTNKGQRLEKIIRLMDSGISSAGFTLASNRTVNLNELTSVQIEDYVERVKEVALSLGITEDITLGEGIENIIKQEIEESGINLDRETLKKIYDFVLYGEDRQGNKIKSKDFTSSLAKSDSAGLRSLDLTNASKALKKVQRIISPFKDVFVDLGIDLLKGVKSAYMSDETNQKNIDLLRDKLQTAIYDLTNYMNEKPENYWESEVHRLRTHLDKVIDKDITDIVATTVEGGVYDYQGDLIKVTGGFAPLNQILGAAYRDKKGIFPTFKQKFMQQESKIRSLKSVFNLIF